MFDIKTRTYKINSFYYLNCIAAVQLQFPEYLHQYGLSEEMVSTVYHQAQNPNATYLSWSLCKPPTLNFYIELHDYLKKCPETRDANKTAIGKFYNAIDPSLRSKMFRPDNAFNFIDYKVKKADLPTSQMSYGVLTQRESKPSMPPSLKVDHEPSGVCVQESTFTDQQCKSQADTICQLKHELFKTRLVLEDISKKCARTEQNLSKAKQTIQVAEGEAITAMQQLSILQGSQKKRS